MARKLRVWSAHARRRESRSAGAGLVIDDDGQVALTLAMADLVDADAGSPE